MGADIHISLGRITQKAITDQSHSTGTEIALLGGKKVSFGDIHIEQFDPDYGDRPYEGLHRNYRLFAFIANVRGHLKPMVDHKRLQEQTRAFVAWLYKEKVESLRGVWPANQLARYDQSEFEYEMGFDDHSWSFYPVAALWAFDYDQIAAVEAECSDWENPVYVLCPQHRTYRDYIDEQWFIFLNKLRRENWDFVIFSFDN